ncbi:hypothetical protein ACIQWA_20615 [Kitasatospora sp. NPDC098652]
MDVIAIRPADRPTAAITANNPGDGRDTGWSRPRSPRDTDAGQSRNSDR